MALNHAARRKRGRRWRDSVPSGSRRQKEGNFARRWTDDPEIKCYMPGVQRATYMPYPFQIVQARTLLYSPSPTPAPCARSVWELRKSPPWIAGWGGPSDAGGGRNEFNDQTWLDRAGDFHGEKLHVVKRYTPRSSDVIDYEATIEGRTVTGRNGVNVGGAFREWPRRRVCSWLA